MRKVKDQADEQARQKGPGVFTMERPQNGLPEDLREHTRLMCDSIAMAFHTDKTRIASLLLCRDLSGLYCPFLVSRAITTRRPTTTYLKATSESPISI